MTADANGTADTGSGEQQSADTKAAGTAQDTRNASADQKSAASGDGNGADPFAELVKDADTREWLGKRNVKDVEGLGKLAREQASLLGSAIRVPGKDATDDERNEFLTKLGRPESPDKYEFTLPENLPEGVAYDAEKAKGLKDAAFKLGLSQQQAQAVHDLYVKDMTETVAGSQQAEADRLASLATSETEKLVKMWGPLDGATAKANMAFADRALNTYPEAKAALKDLKVIGPNGEVLNHSLAVLFANLGTAIFKEDDVIHGRADRVGNPFAEGSFNMTEAMKAWREDADNARSLIAAAGKKPSDFGLPDK
jgi:hypothetical protein